MKNIPMFKVAMSKDVDEELLKVLHSGWIGQGPKVDEFEAKLAKKFNNENVVTLSSGTHGLTLALRLSGVGPGDEVITTPLSCQATCQPIQYFGGKIVWADIKKDLNIDVNSIKENITDKTKAIIVVHWGGFPCDMEEIYTVAKANNIFVIEDAAHCYSSIYKDSIIGDCKYSDFCMISLQAIKFLTASDGGILFTKSKEDYKRARLLRWYGISRDGKLKDMRCDLNNPIFEYGYKFHMNDVNAIIGLGNMKLAEENVKISQDNAAYYNRELSNIDGIEITQNSNDKLSSHWLYSILIERDRNSFIKMMNNKNISTSRVHERLDLHPVNRNFKKDLPILDSIYDKYISIPVGWWISKNDRRYILNCISSGW